MNAVRWIKLRPHYGLAYELLVGRSVHLRTRPNRLANPRFGQGILYRINL